MALRFLIPALNISMVPADGEAALKFRQKIRIFMPLKMSLMALSVKKIIFRKSQMHGGDVLYIPRLAMKKISKPVILCFTFSMGVLKMKQDGHHREKQISFWII